ADVLTRARPEYDARGLRLGSFFLYPSVAAGFGHTDNVFNDASNTEDYFYAVTPGAQLRSAWSRHELDLAVQAKSLWFSNQVTETRTDWSATSDVRFDILRGTEFKAEAHYIDLHEPRGTDLTGGLASGDPAEPTALNRTGFSAEFGHTFNRVHLAI